MLPHLLAEEASREGFKLIHFSTDCVFSGEGGPYGEGDIPDPVDFYGRSKLLGEVEADQSLTIRSSIVGFSIDGTNRGLFDWFISNRGGVVTGYECALYSGVTTLEMSKIVLGIIENHREMSGIWQVSADPIDKASLLSLLNQEMDLGITIEKDDKFRCDRRLVSDRFRQRTGWRPPSWDVMVKELVERLKKSTSDLKG
jgi:dTDP-4-dehydrorhamnose reductase